MTARLTLFAATLVQDAALSVSGVDRESTADQPFAVVDGVPMLSGRGLKGAAVAMSRRFFDPLPRCISEDPESRTAYLRSAWEFANATPEGAGLVLGMRAGVGIRHKTGARAQGVLYDREVVPAGTRWPLLIRVDWSYAQAEGDEAEGILGYVLERHWADGRCWLGGGVARGLGWCHIEDLRAYRLDTDSYDRWVESGRCLLPAALPGVPTSEPSRSWCFRTLDLRISFGEYRPDPDGGAWGLDMLAVGPHNAERTTQMPGSGTWAKPSWADPTEAAPGALATDRAVAMDRGRPLLPGSSVRGPMRHAFSRAKRTDGHNVQDPHPVHGCVDDTDPGGKVFGSVRTSSRILIRDGRAEGDWYAAILHMHAEDELSAGSYGSAKRDAVRVLRGDFPVRIIIDGPDENIVAPLAAEVNRIVALGAIGHLPLGGQKMRGAGWGLWQPEPWSVHDVRGVPRPAAPTSEPCTAVRSGTQPTIQGLATRYGDDDPLGETVWVSVSNGALEPSALTLGGAAGAARGALGERTLAAWWCEPAIDVSRNAPPAVFGREWPVEETLKVEEVAFYAEGAVWRAAQTAAGTRWAMVQEAREWEPDAIEARVTRTTGRLHASSRFSAAQTGTGRVVLREWHRNGEMIGFTFESEAR